jgi:hypothetical protein
MSRRRRAAWVGIIAVSVLIFARVQQHARREHNIYDALFQAGQWAMNQAARRYPPSVLYSADRKRDERMWAARRAYYEDRKQAAREAVAEDFGLTAAELQAIEQKGDKLGWLGFDNIGWFNPSKVRPPGPRPQQEKAPAGSQPRPEPNAATPR